MDPEPNVIREQIEETRSSLTEKLETLEAEVKGTVQSARETVEETISSVKETVQTATETVKRTFDIPYQVDRHPWAMMGLSLLGGVALGVLLGGRRGGGARIADRMSEASVVPPERYDGRPQARAEPERPGFLDTLSSRLGVEMDKVKDQAIDALVGVVADVARKSIPALAQGVETMMTEAAAQVGAPSSPEARDTGNVGQAGYRPPGYEPPPANPPLGL